MPGEPARSHRTVGLRCESAVDPLGLGVARPRLSWRLETDRRGACQGAYQVIVTDGDAPDAGILWDSGLVTGTAATQVVYAGPPPRSGQRCFWRVRTQDERGILSAWSEPAWWEMGLLANDWQAGWISPAFDAATESETPPVPYLRRRFRIERPVRAARLYITSHGLFEAHLNGQRVGDDLLTPGWTSYHKRLLVCTYDVTHLMRAGENVLGALLGEGWYRGRIGAIGGRRCAYGTRLALLAQLHVTHSDGSRTVIGTDETWRAFTGPIRASGLYDGETYDARLELPGWSAPGFDDTAWEGVERIGASLEVLECTPGPWVRRTESLRPAGVRRTGDATCIYDFGQNMTGWVRLSVRGQPGMRITLRHAEVLEADGSLHTANLRSAKQTDSIILANDDTTTGEPHFTFHGFRYVEICADPAWPAELDVTGIVVHSNLEMAGTFACSDERLNQLQRNIVWGQRGNFVDVPTDCPQRDERLGWGGDAQVFATTACFNMDCARFLAKWVRDLYADQHASGAFPIVAPLPQTVIDELSPRPGQAPPFQVRTGYGAGGYADAGVIVPWTLYQAYGDRRILEECYPGMVRWVEGVVQDIDDDLIVDGWFQFGDWLAPHAPTIPDLAATAYFNWSVRLLGRIAALLQHDADAARFESLGSALRAAFCKRYLREDGRIEPESQSAYVLALAFDLLPDAQRPAAASRLVADIRARGNHLATGFLGTPHLTQVLADTGYLDVAYDLLLQDSYPSWLYPLTQGATTIWERWNGVEPDGTLFHPSMNSFNHYAYGAIGAFLYRTVAGLDMAPGACAYDQLLIRPRPGGGLTSAAARLKTPHGVVDLAWRIENDQFLLDITLPPNTGAMLHLPVRAADSVREGGVSLDAAEAVAAVHPTADGLQVAIGAGRYRFEMDYQAPGSLPSPAARPDYRYPRFSIFTSVGAILDDPAALAVVARNISDMDSLGAVMARRRMYSLQQLQAFVPGILSSSTLERLDHDLSQLG